MNADQEKEIIKSVDIAVSTAFESGELKSEGTAGPSEPGPSQQPQPQPQTEEMKGNQKMVDLMNRANFLRIKDTSFQYGFYQKRDESGYVVIERFENNHRFDLHKVWENMQSEIAVDDNFNMGEWIKSLENVKDFKSYSVVYLVKEY